MPGHNYYQSPPDNMGHACSEIQCVFGMPVNTTVLPSAHAAQHGGMAWGALLFSKFEEIIPAIRRAYEAHALELCLLIGCSDVQPRTADERKLEVLHGRSDGELQVGVVQACKAGAPDRILHSTGRIDSHLCTADGPVAPVAHKSMCVTAVL